MVRDDHPDYFDCTKRGLCCRPREPAWRQSKGANPIDVAPRISRPKKDLSTCFVSWPTPVITADYGVPTPLGQEIDVRFCEADYLGVYTAQTISYFCGIA